MRFLSSVVLLLLVGCKDNSWEERHVNAWKWQWIEQKERGNETP